MHSLIPMKCKYEKLQVKEFENKILTQEVLPSISTKMVRKKLKSLEYDPHN